MSITIKEIGELAGVSKTTVSKVINNKDENISQATREKILKIMKEKIMYQIN
ncbi:LacI family DNA-binding transcriptional regulator [Clostridioides difficile]